MSLTAWKIRNPRVEWMAKRAEDLGVVLFTFVDREGDRIFMARLPQEGTLARTLTVCARGERPSQEAQDASQLAVVEQALAEMGKRRTPAHVTYFAKLERRG